MSCRARLCLSTYLADDADLAAVGEAAFGAGVGATDVAYLTISTGIGAGVVHDGRLLRGSRSSQKWDTRSSTGPRGGRNHPARSRSWDRAAVWRAWHTRPASGPLDARGIESAMKSGEADALAIWRGAIAACAVGICNLVMTFYWRGHRRGAGLRPRVLRAAP